LDVFHNKFQKSGFMPLQRTPEVPGTLDLALLWKKAAFAFRK
jgi:hypothetical protein